MTDENEIALPPKAAAADNPAEEIVSWDQIADDPNLTDPAAQMHGITVDPGPNNPAHVDNQPGKLRAAVIGEGVLADAQRIMFDMKITDVYTCKSMDDLEQLIEFKPQVVFLCTELGLLKNGSVDDAEMLACVKRLSQETRAGVCVKTTINIDTADRIAHTVGAEWFMNKFIYSPELGETLDEILGSDILLVGGGEKPTEMHSKILVSGTYNMQKEILSGTVNEIVYIKLGLVGYKAVKQTFFNQMHSAVMDIEGANPAMVRRGIAKCLPHENDRSFMIPTFVRAQADESLSMKQVKSFGGEFANRDAKLFVSMTDRLSLLEECINLRNLKD